MDPIIAVCQSKPDQQQWVNALSPHKSLPVSLKGSPPFVMPKGAVQPPLPPHKSTIGSPSHVSQWCGKGLKIACRSCYSLCSPCLRDAALLHKRRHTCHGVNDYDVNFSSSQSKVKKCNSSLDKFIGSEIKQKPPDEPYSMEICANCDLPLSVPPHLSGGKLYDSSCSCEHRTVTFIRYIWDKNVKNSRLNRGGGRDMDSPLDFPYPYRYDKRKEPYILFSRHIKRLYKKKIITASLMRDLSGDPYDLEAAKFVKLRCSVKEALCDGNPSDLCRKTFSAADDLSPLEELKNTAIRSELLAPQPQRKHYANLLNETNLQKWKCSPQLEDNAVAELALNSSFSSKCSFTRDFSSLDGNFFRIDKPTKRNTYIKCASIEAHMLGSHPLSNPNPTLVDPEKFIQLHGADSDGGDNPIFISSLSVVLKVDRTNNYKKFPSGLCLLGDIKNSDSCCSSPNICNRTIYESSSDVQLNGPRLLPKLNRNMLLKQLLNSKTSISNYYFSSCSADETEADCSDFYASSRDFYSLFNPLLSRSEPSLYYDQTFDSRTYANHYVRIKVDVNIAEQYDSHSKTVSHHSSDSGVVDVTLERYTDSCPTKNALSDQFPGAIEGVGFRATSNAYSNSDELKWYQKRVPVHTIQLQPSGSHVFYEGDKTFKSFLYAHWWMKVVIDKKLLKNSIRDCKSGLKTISFPNHKPSKASHHAIKSRHKPNSLFFSSLCPGNDYKSNFLKEKLSSHPPSKLSSQPGKNESEVHPANFKCSSSKGKLISECLQGKMCACEEKCSRNGRCSINHAEYVFERGISASHDNVKCCCEDRGKKESSDLEKGWDGKKERSAHTEEESSISEGENSASEGENSASEGENSASEGENSASEGENSASEGENSASEGENSASEGENSASEGENSASEGENSASEGENSASEGENSASEGKNSASEGENSASEGENSASEGENSASEDKNSASEDENSASEDENSASEDENSASEDENSASEDENSASEDESSASEDESSASEDESSASEDESSASEDESSASEDESSATEDESSASEDESSASEDESSASEDESSASEDESSASEDESSASEDENCASEDENCASEDKNSSSEEENSSEDTSVSGKEISTNEEIFISDNGNSSKNNRNSSCEEGCSCSEDGSSGGDGRSSKSDERKLNGNEQNIVHKEANCNCDKQILRNYDNSRDLINLDYCDKQSIRKLSKVNGIFKDEACKCCEVRTECNYEEATQFNNSNENRWYDKNLEQTLSDISREEEDLATLEEKYMTRQKEVEDLAIQEEDLDSHEELEDLDSHEELEDLVGQEGEDLARQEQGEDLARQEQGEDLTIQAEGEDLPRQEEGEDLARQEGEDLARQEEGEDFIRQEGEDFIRQEGEDLARQEEGEDFIRQEEEDFIRQEGEDLARQEEEDLARQEGEDLARQEGEDLARQEEEDLARQEGEDLTGLVEGEDLARQEGEDLTGLVEGEDLARQEGEDLARQEDEEDLARQEGEDLARQEGEDLARQEGEDLARQEDEEDLARQEDEEDLDRQEDEEDLARQEEGEDLTGLLEGEDLARQEGEDLVRQGEGEDLVRQEGEDLVRQKEGEDLVGQEGEDLVRQEEGEDLVRQEEGEDLVRQEEGEDLVRQKEGEDLVGQEGEDLVRQEGEDLTGLVEREDLARQEEGEDLTGLAERGDLVRQEEGEDLIGLVEREDLVRQEEREDLVRQEEGEDLTGLVEREDLARQEEGEDLTELVEREDLVRQEEGEDLTGLVEREDLARQEEGEYLVGFVEREDLVRQEEAEDLTGLVEREDLARQEEGEDLAGFVEREDLVRQEEAEDLTGLVERENLARQEEGEDLVRQEEGEDLVRQEEGEHLVRQEEGEDLVRQEGEDLARQEEGEDLARQEEGEDLARQEGENLARHEEGEEDLARQEGEEDLARQEEGEDLTGLVEGEDLTGLVEGEDLVGQEEGEDLARQEGEDLVRQERNLVDHNENLNEHLGSLLWEEEGKLENSATDFECVVHVGNQSCRLDGNFEKCVCVMNNLSSDIDLLNSCNNCGSCDVYLTDNTFNSHKLKKEESKNLDIQDQTDELVNFDTCEHKKSLPDILDKDCVEFGRKSCLSVDHFETTPRSLENNSPCQVEERYLSIEQAKTLFRSTSEVDLSEEKGSDDANDSLELIDHYWRASDHSPDECILYSCDCFDDSDDYLDIPLLDFYCDGRESFSPSVVSSSNYKNTSTGVFPVYDVPLIERHSSASDSKNSLPSILELSEDYCIDCNDGGKRSPSSTGTSGSDKDLDVNRCNNCRENTNSNSKPAISDDFSSVSQSIFPQNMIGSAYKCDLTVCPPIVSQRTFSPPSSELHSSLLLNTNKTQASSSSEMHPVPSAPQSEGALNEFVRIRFMDPSSQDAGNECPDYTILVQSTETLV